MALFNPDIFSQSIPKWNKAQVSLVNKLCPVLEQLTPSIKCNTDIEYSGASEINSENYRIYFENKFVVKKWPKGKDVKNIKSIEKVTYFLNGSDIPVADIIPFKDGETIKRESNFGHAVILSLENFILEKDQLKQVSILTVKAVAK